MAYLNLGGHETGNGSEALASSGSWIIDNNATTKRTGTYGMYLNIAGTGSGYLEYGGYGTNGVHGELGRTAATYYIFYFRANTIPAAGCGLGGVYNSAGSVVARLSITSAGALTMIGATTSATIATLSTNTWYRIEMTVVSNGTSETKVNGGTAQTCTANNVTQDRLRLGSSVTLDTIQVAWDDWAISDSAYPGVGEVRILKPNATGNYTAWTDGAGTAPTNVAEVPHTSDTGYITSSTATQAETEALDSAATGGIVGTIGAVKSIVIVRDEGGVSSLNIRTRSATTDQDTVGVDPGATYVALAKLNSTDPATSAAWTSGGLDALEVGVLNNNAVAVRCTAIYAMVWSTGVASTVPSFKRSLLGVGV